MAILDLQLFGTILTTPTTLTSQLFGGKFDFHDEEHDSGGGGGSPNTFDSFMEAFITVCCK